MFVLKFLDCKNENWIVMNFFHPYLIQAVHTPRAWHLGKCGAKKMQI